MERKINLRLIFIALLSMALTLLFSFWVLRTGFDVQAREGLAESAQLAAAAYSSMASPGQLSALASDTLRVTLISPGGMVLFDSAGRLDRMENHLSRPEVVQALEGGQGADARFSVTLQATTYYHALLLPDGNILRLARDTGSVYGVYRRSAPVLAAIVLMLIAVSVFLAIYLTRGLLRPIVEMGRNIETIDQNVPYKELEPFARAIRDQQQHRQEGEKLRQEFTANVSHELKTPLTSISGYAEMIETGIAEEKDIRDFAGKIRFEAGRLIRLIGDILQLSQLDEKTRGAAHEEIDLLYIAQSTAEYLSLQAEKAGVTMEIHGEAVNVQGDKTVMEEMVYNLCDNAIRYNKPGGKVILQTGHHQGKPFISVQDTGIGIPEEHQSRIFERFYRVDKSRSRDSGGTGLGLAIAKHAAMQHGAELFLESVVGQGTTITVRFMNREGPPEEVSEGSEL